MSAGCQMIIQRTANYTNSPSSQERRFEAECPGVTGHHGHKRIHKSHETSHETGTNQVNQED